MRDWAWRWGPAVVQMVLIFIASSIPDLRRLPADVSDHTGHFIGYALLGALVLRAVARVRWTGVTGMAAFSAWLFSTMYGVTDEFHQHFVHGRTPAADDVAADAAGAALAVLLALALAVFRRRRNRAV